jgi:hypothetical protein
MNERTYQRKLILRIRDLIPGIHVMVNDPQDTQGMPDLILLYGDTWAMLEVKASPKSNIQPNQKYYVDKYNKMSFAAFINPDNEDEVLDALQHALGIKRETRIS